MIVEVHNQCDDYASYRAARVKSLFNVETGANFDLIADLPLDGQEWKLGLVVGPSGSGKSSIGRTLWPDAFYEPDGWPSDAPIIDSINPEGKIDDVTAALAAVGLGTVPSWLRPYPVLSTGEKFRADLARVVCEQPDRVVFDEFTSVVDRQIAKIGALAFSKAWRRTPGRAILLSCHYDIVEWLQPDWIFDTESRDFTWGCLQPRPRISVDVHATDWRFWPRFEPHHYLRLGPMPFAQAYVATVDDEPVAHLGMGSKYVGKQGVEARACRLVVMPEWQGAGVGVRFLNHVCQRYLDGDGHGKLAGRPMTTQFHTSHPGLCAALRRDKRWVQISASLHGTNRGNSMATMKKSDKSKRNNGRGGFGGHFRAVQGFRFIGEAS